MWETGAESGVERMLIYRNAGAGRDEDGQGCRRQTGTVRAQTCGGRRDRPRTGKSVRAPLCRWLWFGPASTLFLLPDADHQLGLTLRRRRRMWQGMKSTSGGGDVKEQRAYGNAPYKYPVPRVRRFVHVVLLAACPCVRGVEGVGGVVDASAG
ncbi:hypothetical protein B0H16DRAFT_1517812 [Mycena metata]|uniref:Uncharacterized protein n=1 Tax=Mycena metata TaxID=1033252 RepID=A0AAD7JPY7_9AGAR|nr:hypothetical protein B0H16DRAFT_1517812 [Mycena metata]